MKEKEIAIIEGAIKLFAIKGFTATSIQDIATECGISKGAFYLYFKSKTALLLSIFEYYYDQIKTQLDEIESKNLPPRELFVEQLASQFEEMSKHKEFIIMQAREQAIPFNNEIANFLSRMREQSQIFFQKAFLTIYGEEIRPYLIDLTLIVQGINKSYFEMIMFNKTPLDFNYLARFILKRIDSLVEGLKDSGEAPVILEFPVVSLFEKKNGKSELLKIIAAAKGKVPAPELVVSLEVIEEEIKSDAPRKPVIQGMLATLNGVKELADLQAKVAGYFKVKLI
ncbi:TetR/AcrR family transcriptional regulator [Neobacillus sp. LXY-4]|uniref:TetR/AcrR family transcriptional regulator n=1 Tax=Neobacillus sp. LXY-4 TaxID=3379826 RepID=UPI003EE16043